MELRQQCIEARDRVEARERALDVDVSAKDSDSTNTLIIKKNRLENLQGSFDRKIKRRNKKES